MLATEKCKTKIEGKGMLFEESEVQETLRVKTRMGSLGKNQKGS